jgi:hypothetical protein
MNRKIKTEIALGIILIISIIIGGIIWFGVQQQTRRTRQIAPVAKTQPATTPATQPVSQLIPTNKNTGWQIYTNTKYGYTVQYPKSWFSYTDNTSDTFFQPSKEIPDGIPGPHANAFEIKVTQTSEKLDAIISALKKNSGVKFERTNVKIGDEDGVKIVSNCEGLGCGAPEWMLVKNGSLYHFLSNLGYSS